MAGPEEEVSRQGGRVLLRRGNEMQWRLGKDPCFTPAANKAEALVSVDLFCKEFVRLSL